MNNPFFSVIIPTYNQASFLRKALNSVMRQEFKNFEIIIIDNFSTDETEKIIKSFKKKIIYKKIKNRGIIAKSRNKGIQLSKGKWLAFLDSDDLWSSNKLKEIHEQIKRVKFDVICNDEWIVFGKKSISSLWSYGPYQDNFYKKLLINGNCISTSASVINKKFLKKNKIKFDENRSFITTEDYEFFLNISKKKGKFYFYHKPLGIHLFHDLSASSNYSKHRKSLLSVLKYHVFKIQTFTKKRKDLWEEVKFNVEFVEILNFLYGHNNKVKSIKMALKAVSKKPFKFSQMIFIDLMNKLKRLIFYYMNIILQKPETYEKN